MKRMAAVLLLAVVIAVGRAASGGVVSETSFTVPAPAGWEMTGAWAAGRTGARADGASTAAWTGSVPAGALIEVLIDLPEADALGKAPTVALSLGGGKDDPERITASCAYTRVGYQAKLVGVAPDKKAREISVAGDTRPAAWLTYERNRGEDSRAADYPGWASTTVSLGLMATPGGCRLFLNGSECGRAALTFPAARRLALSATGLTVRRVRVLSALPEGYAYLGGAAAALRSGGLASRTAVGMPVGALESRQIDVLGVPMLVQAGRNGLAVLDVGAEGSAIRPAGTVGILRLPAPMGVYSTAYLLLHDDGAGAETQAAMGFGLRPGNNPGGEVHNIYLRDIPSTAPDTGVVVRPVPALGQGWYAARVPLNPATLQWQTHAPDGSLLARETPSAFDLCAARTWGAINPQGKRSSLQLAAVTLKAAPMDLIVTGNGLGNVYAEPETPKLTTTLRNLTDRSLSLTLQCELRPFGYPAKATSRQVTLKPRATLTLDALAAPARERGHYQARVTVTEAQGHRVDYRTNLALLAPDTRKKIDSPFGIWPALYGEVATDTQQQYLKEKAGVGFFHGKDHLTYNPGTPMPDDATAEAFVVKSDPNVRIVMLGWEQTWEKYTFDLPRIISEGLIEAHSPAQLAQMDETVARFRRIIRATRKLRPNAKISLGNSGINYTVPLLERGLKFGVDFDYFGTEEGVYSFLPERWDSSIGNVNWWTKAVSDHYGFGEVPIFHSEAFYYNTGFGLAGMSGRTQAAYYLRLYLLGLPYRSIYGFTGALIDSSNDYAYSLWGTPAYCNRGPECSPKPSYVAFATLTQLLDGARYDRLLETGSTSVYALQFRRPDGSPLTALWTVYGARKASLGVTAGGRPDVRDAFNRPVNAPVKAGRMELVLSDLPVYVAGATLQGISLRENIPEPAPGGRVLGSLAVDGEWSMDTARNGILEAPAWCMPRAPGQFSLATANLPAAPGMPAVAGMAPALTVRLTLPVEATPLGVQARYVALTRAPGKEIAIPKGTMKLGVWIYGRSTFAQVMIGVKDTRTGATRFIGLIIDNFDGWRCIDIGRLQDAVAGGFHVINRLAVCMPPQQVYVKEVRPTARPEIGIGAVVATTGTLPLVNYLPW